MKKHIGSSVAIVIGVLSIIAGLTKHGAILFSGIVIILGAFAYRSAKKRTLGEVKSSLPRIISEVIAIIIAMSIVLLQNNLIQAIESDPVPNLIIPLWVLIAYIIISIRKTTHSANTHE